MRSIRRWYIFLASAVSLQVITHGTINLIRSLLPPGSRGTTEELALFIAVIIVGLPFFLVHWLWAQRLATRRQEETEAGLRRLYLYAIIGSFLAPLAANIDGLIGSALRSIFDLGRQVGFTFNPRSEGEMMADSLIAIIILSALAFYHWRVVSADERLSTDDGIGRTVRRLFIFTFSSAGLVMVALSATRLLRLALYQFGAGSIGRRASEAILGEEPARLITGLLLWLFFWLWAQRLFEIGHKDERTSGLRKLYLYAAVFGSVMTVVINTAMILTGFLRRLLDLQPEGDIRDPLPLIIGLGIVWVYHAFVLGQDAEKATESRQGATARRLYFYLVAAVGLAAVLVGLAGDTSVFIRALDRSGLTSALREELAIFTASLISGLPVWLLAWRPIRIASVLASPEGNDERRSVVRRIYLYFYIFVATMTVLASAIYIVTQFINLILGGRGSSGLLSDLGQPLAFILIAVAVWLYHGFLLRGDGRRGQAAEAERMAQWRVAILDPEDSLLGQALLDGLERALPGLTLMPLGFSAEATQRMNGPDALTRPDQVLGEADIIVGPWTIAVPTAAGAGIPSETAEAIAQSPARKLLLPTGVEGWDWAGVDHLSTEDAVRQVVHNVKQIIDGEKIEPDRPLSTGAIIVIVIAILIGLPILIMSIIGFFFSL